MPKLSLLDIAKLMLPKSQELLFSPSASHYRDHKIIDDHIGEDFETYWLSKYRSDDLAVVLSFSKIENKADKPIKCYAALGNGNNQKVYMSNMISMKINETVVNPTFTIKVPANNTKDVHTLRFYVGKYVYGVATDDGKVCVYKLTKSTATAPTTVAGCMTVIANWVRENKVGGGN